MTQQSRTQSSGGNLWSKFFYNSIDLVTTAEQGTGSVTSNPELVQTTTRDLAGRPTSISYQSGTNALATYSMAYVSASNRLASLTTPQGTTNYGYSANGQLIQAGSTGYTYDANGNPTNRAGKTTQIGTWNRLLDDGDFTYQYDAEGRTTGRTSKTTGQTESYVWNRRGQLTQIDVHSNAARTNRTGQVNYSYDPTGRRTSVRNQTGIGSSSYAQSVDYLMSDGDQVGQILGATGQTTRRFRYGIGVDSVLSEQRFSGGTASNPEYQLTDHLGTVRGVAQRTTGVNAAVVNTLQYDSFGKLISQSNASKQPYHGFAGRDIEPVGGLTYNRNRYYSPQTGRFISQDPIGFNAGDENLYRYVANSPTNATDPSGLIDHRKTPSGRPWWAEMFEPDPSDLINPLGMASKPVTKPLSKFVERVLGRKASNKLADAAAKAIEKRLADAAVNAAKETPLIVLQDARLKDALDKLAPVQYTIKNSPEMLELELIISRAADRAPVKPVPEGYTRVYRAVSEAEYEQILRTGKFEVPPGRPGFSPMNAKWFADSAEGAAAHGNSLPGLGKGKYRIIEADVPNNPPSLYRHPNMDGLGPARCIDLDDLNGVQPRPAGS
jgi:RHS repeat-associated protein